MSGEAATHAGTDAAPTANPSQSEFIESFRHPLTLKNPIRDLTPGTVFFVLLSMAIVAASRPGVIWQVAIILAYFVISFAAGVGRGFAKVYVRLIIFAGGILFIARALVLPGEHVLFTIGALRVSTESIAAAGHIVLMILALCGAVTLLFTVVPMKKLMWALEMSGLTSRATFVVLSAFQAITSLGEHSKVVADAQKSRGIETEGSPLARAKAFVPILAPVFLAALNETEERALALDARAFEAPNKHTHLVTLRRRSALETLLIVLALTTAAASILGAVFQWF